MIFSNSCVPFFASLLNNFFLLTSIAVASIWLRNSFKFFILEKAVPFFTKSNIGSAFFDAGLKNHVFYHIFSYLIPYILILSFLESAATFGLKMPTFFLDVGRNAVFYVGFFAGMDRYLNYVFSSFENIDKRLAAFVSLCGLIFDLFFALILVPLIIIFFFGLASVFSYTPLSSFFGFGFIKVFALAIRPLWMRVYAIGIIALATRLMPINNSDGFHLLRPLMPKELEALLGSTGFLYGLFFMVFFLDKLIFLLFKILPTPAILTKSLISLIPI